MPPASTLYLSLRDFTDFFFLFIFFSWENIHDVISASDLAEKANFHVWSLGRLMEQPAETYGCKI